MVNLNLDPMTGKHKGFAFIWYDIPEAAQLAIEVVSILRDFPVNIIKLL